MSYPSQLETVFGRYIGAGSTRDEIDAVMRGFATGIDGEHADRTVLAGEVMSRVVASNPHPVLIGPGEAIRRCCLLPALGSSMIPAFPA